MKAAAAEDSPREPREIMTAVAANGPVEPLHETPLQWSMVTESLRKPYRVTIPMVVLVLLVPLYLFIPQFAAGKPSVPALSLDYRIPQQPAWAHARRSVRRAQTHLRPKRPQ